MTTDNNRVSYVRYLKKVKERGQVLPGFDEIVTILIDEAKSNGLENEDIILIADVLKEVHFSVAKSCSLIKCMIPKYKISNTLLKDMILWYIKLLENGQVSLSILMLQWIIGVLEYDLADRTTVNIFYEVFFFQLLQKERLEVYLAQIIYELTEPEDVTRSQVIKLLNQQKNYKKSQKHLTALLSLFKSYKPEFVPEKIPAIGIGNVWKPLPNEFLQGFGDAKSRAALQENFQKTSGNFKWCTTSVSGRGKKNESILPSVEYFNIGSSVFKEKNKTSIFDVCNVEALGKYHVNVELPSNATSLLTNTAGYHLLMFADFSYQTRFCYNLYITLRTAFLLEPNKYPNEELARLLDMTYEFLRYLQHGIPVVTRFLDDYFSFRMITIHQSKLIELTQWIPLSFTVFELEEYVLKHLRLMFFESSVKEKCEIIRTLRLMLLNLCANYHIRNSSENSESPFLHQKCKINLEEIVPAITKFAQSLIASGFNNHSDSLIFMSEALHFYEQISITEYQFSMNTWTIAPTVIIHGGFLSKSCLILSRICSLLLNYRKGSEKILKRKLMKKFHNELNEIELYAYDLRNILWEGKSFSNRKQGGKFLMRLSDKSIEELSINMLDKMLCLNYHYAILPYKVILNMSGLNIQSREDLFKVAVQFFPAVSEFLRIAAGLEIEETEEV